MSNRSNGARAQRPQRIASCEACRLSKLACDHQHPCSRCVSRDIPDECVYRKNAFKRSRSSMIARISDLRRLRSFDTAPMLGTVERVLPVSRYPNPGFQGSSSLNSVLDNLREQTTLLEESESSLSGCQDGEASSSFADQSMNDTSTIEGAQLLELLLNPAIENNLKQIILEWTGNGLESHVGAFLVKPFFDSITGEIARLRRSENRQSDLLTLSRHLFENSSRDVNVHRSMTLQDFLGRYMGSNLRWETVGVVLTLAGIACTELRAPHALYKTEQDRQTLRMNFVHFGNKCATFCESLDVLNDVHIIFLYQIFQFQSVFYGDQSLKTWRRLNDAAGALLAAGLHENFQQGHNASFFLCEVRKRIFSRLYGIDISLATFLGRPPRMSKRFCSINFPLDIDENIYSITGSDLNTELAKLDQDGWNTHGHIRMGAVLRWSTTTAMIREDTLELLLGQNVSDVQQRIFELRLDISDAWAKLPRFLIVLSHELWHSPRSRCETECLHQIRLFYLQSVFLIEWAAWRHGIEQSALFQSATELLSWVNEALIHREQLLSVGFVSLAWRVASCALPAAGALALYLLQPSSRSRLKHIVVPLRRETIESLSVLIAHIDILHSPSDGNFKLFAQAKRSLQSVIDLLLQPLDAPELNTPSTEAAADQSAIDWMASDYCGFNGGFWVNFPDCLYMGENEDSIFH